MYVTTAQGEHVPCTLEGLGPRSANALRRSYRNSSWSSCCPRSNRSSDKAAVSLRFLSTSSPRTAIIRCPHFYPHHIRHWRERLRGAFQISARYYCGHPSVTTSTHQQVHPPALSWCRRKTRKTWPHRMNPVAIGSIAGHGGAARSSVAIPDKCSRLR